MRRAVFPAFDRSPFERHKPEQTAKRTSNGGPPAPVSVEKEAPDQDPVIAEHARDGNDGEHHNQSHSNRRSLVA